MFGYTRVTRQGFRAHHDLDGHICNLDMSAKARRPIRLCKEIIVPNFLLLLKADLK